MGRFLDVNSPPPAAVAAQGLSTRVEVPQGFQPQNGRAPGWRATGLAPTLAPFREITPGTIQVIGFFLISVYIVSNLANDISLRLIGSRAYLSLIAGLLLPVVALLSGTGLRFLQHTAGRCWLFMLFWMALAGAFSTWRGGSFTVIQEFTTKNWVLLVYISAVTLTLSQCVRLVYLNVFSCLIVIVSCFAFGDFSTGRLTIPGSIFFDNSNDLAIQLLISGSFVLFLLFSDNLVARFIGVVLSGVTLFLLLKTGSRAGFLSLIVCIIVALVISERRGRMLAVLIPLCIIGISLMPAEQFKRLTYFVFSPETSEVRDEDGALLSQLERTELLKRSVALTVQHPLFGVGPGQFAEVVRLEFKRDGVKVPFLNTHNTYTQISSENGVIPLVAYLIVLLGSLRSTYRIYRWATTHRQVTLANVSFCLVIALTSYSVTSFFHHVAYTRQLPTLAGMSLAVWFCARPLIDQVRANSAHRVPVAV